MLVTEECVGIPLASETNARLAVMAAASVIAPEPLFVTSLFAVPAASLLLAMAAKAFTSALTIEPSKILPVGSAAIVIEPLPLVIVTPEPAVRVDVVKVLPVELPINN
ncbi:hypothetical protein D3C72_846080 [compost metagenome]